MPETELVVMPPTAAIKPQRWLSALPLSDLLSLAAEPTPWVWEPFVPQEAVTLLVGYAKAGKSTLIYPLIIAVARGEPFLESPTQQGAVLVLSEEPKGVVGRRLQAFGATPEDLIHIHLLTASVTDLGVDELQDFIAKHSIRLLVIDTLTPFWNVNDENDNRKVALALLPITQLARRTNVGIVIAHHEGKNEEGSKQGRSIRGASALFGQVDQALMLHRRDGGKPNQRVLRSLGRYDETPRELFVELDGTDYRRLGDGSALTLAESIERVRSALSDVPMTEAALIAATELSRKAVRAALKALGPAVLCEGGGKKGSPHTYRKAVCDSVSPLSEGVTGTESNPSTFGSTSDAVPLPPLGSSTGTEPDERWDDAA